MQRVIRSFFVVVTLGFFTVSFAQLPPEIMVDAYLLQVEQSIRGGDFDRARIVIQNIRNLQEQHDLDLSGEFHFRYAKAADSLDLPEQALVSIVKYLVISGREGQHYLEALGLMNRVRDRSSGDVVTVVSSHLSPNIMADAYLLQAERAIRDGDPDQAQTSMQNIRNLQEQHELDLPNEFHFRYAKAADSVDLFEQALESVVKYLTASGREGQHYVEALELMNKMQTAVSCKGWNTEEYFKTATLEEVTVCLDAGIDLEARDDSGLTPLHRAVQDTENPDVIKSLINAGANLEAQAKDKQTPLHVAAAYSENPDVIKSLINTGANLEAQAKDKQTPLYWAVSFKNLSAIKVLIDAGADKASVNNRWTSLHWVAAYNENPDIIKSLINAGADVKARAEVKRTPLHVAAAYNENPDIIKSLINAGADVKARAEVKRTPLHYALYNNKNPDVVKVLLDAGADPNAREYDDRTPLHTAAEDNENPDVVKMLLDAGADVKARAKYRKTPLHYAAASNDNPDVIKVLLDAGADPMVRNNWDWTPLHLAAEDNDNPDVIKVLLDAGADPNARSNFGRTPLHLAAEDNDNPDVIKVLLDAGADPNARTKDHNTPLHYAVLYKDNPDVVKVLLDAGTDPNTRNEDGWTLLHYAASYYGEPDVVKVLLDAGADPNARDEDGDTPLDIAAKDNKNSRVAEALRAAGATRKKKEDGLGKVAAALIGGAAITYIGVENDVSSEVVAEAVGQFMEGVLTEQPVGSGNSNSAATPSQTQGGQSQNSVQQALQNLENVCGEKYQGNFADNDHYRFYCMAAFNDYCALKRVQSSEAISKLRASLQQNCAVLKSVGADSKCSYCK